MDVTNILNGVYLIRVICKPLNLMAFEGSIPMVTDKDRS